MLTHTPSHPKFARRTMLQAGSVGLLGLGMNHVQALRAAEVATAAQATPRAKSVIFHLSLRRPDAARQLRPQARRTRRKFAASSTPSPRARRACGSASTCRMLAARSDTWSLIRSLTTPYNEPFRRAHVRCSPAARRCRPAYNGEQAAVDRLAVDRSRSAAALPPRNNNLPPAVVLPERLIHNSGRVIPGQFGGMMGSRRDPWFIEALAVQPEVLRGVSGVRVPLRRGREQQPNR